MENLIKIITDEFCEAYTTKEECVGSTRFLIATGMLPEGVNPEDPRVKQIIQWCKENAPQNKNEN